jgi:hypothetical protein
MKFQYVEELEAKHTEKEDVVILDQFTNFADFRPKDLVMYLHAWKYSVSPK